MGSVFDTLFLPINQGLISLPNTRDGIGVFGAQPHQAMDVLRGCRVHVQQYFKPYHDAFQADGYDPRFMDDFEPESLSIAFIHAPQNQLEAHYFIARVSQFLKTDGVLICAANNKTGGTRLHKLLAKIGLIDTQKSSKHKARVCWGTKKDLDRDFIQTCLKKGQMQRSSQTKFMTQPGIFGWDKIDQGSEILAHIFKQQLSGTVADFGCGYGYLSTQALKGCDKVRTLYAFDADWRAIESCRSNCSSLDKSRTVHYEWIDLTKPNGLKNFDHIIMNPPFHIQKQTDISVGIQFIEQAYKALKNSGQLWMVANVHLPYEDTLKNLFAHIEKTYEDKGFKVFIAQK